MDAKKKKIKFTVKPKPKKKKIVFKVKETKKDRRYPKEIHDIKDYEPTKVRPFRKHGKLYYKNLEKHRGWQTTNGKNHDFFTANLKPMDYDPGYDENLKVKYANPYNRGRKVI